MLSTRRPLLCFCNEWSSFINGIILLLLSLTIKTCSLLDTAALQDIYHDCNGLTSHLMRVVVLSDRSPDLSVQVCAAVIAVDGSIVRLGTRYMRQ